LAENAPKTVRESRRAVLFMAFFPAESVRDAGLGQTGWSERAAFKSERVTEILMAGRG